MSKNSYLKTTCFDMQASIQRTSSINWIFSKSIFLVTVCVFAGVSCLAADRQQYVANVKRIIDGDSLTVQIRSEMVKVRLWGIDTPEYFQRYSKAAKKLTSQFVRNQTVQLEVKDWDKYGRMVAIVTMADGRSLNEELLKNGLAWVHIYYCKEAICDRWYSYEKEARKKKIGLWHDRSPVPPWEWKRYHKKR